MVFRYEAQSHLELFYQPLLILHHRSVYEFMCYRFVFLVRYRSIEERRKKKTYDGRSENGHVASANGDCLTISTIQNQIITTF